MTGQITAQSRLATGLEGGVVVMVRNLGSHTTWPGFKSQCGYFLAVMKPCCGSVSPSVQWER